MATESGTSFKLSKTYKEHEQDVRGVCEVEGSDLVCSSSRDRSVRVWNRTTGETFKVLYGHEHFVGVVICLPPSPFFSSHQCSIISGGNDKIINVWDLDTANPYLTLIGHTESVVALSHVNGLLISGSWDKTARVWKGNECVEVLKGHGHSVWAVLGIDNGDIITGSADKTIKIWRNGQCINTLSKHTDCVRGLANIPTVGFLSCGNDSMIFAWSYSGEVLMQLTGHDSFIYSVNVLTTGEFISSGEDCCLKVWRDGHCVDTIQHPTSVWVCAGLSNGDIITGCADGKARIWTRSSSRIAPPEEIEEYTSGLQNAVTTTTGGSVGDINVDKLSGPEALNIPGTKDGESKLIKNGNMVEAHKWSAANNQWLKIGDVVDARSTSSKQVMEGKQYDYIFDVDIGDGQNRKLGYNNTENPYTVAQEFLWREELDQGFLDTVAQFIIRNAQPVTIGTASSTGTYRDPFTGSNRYVPGGDEQSMDYTYTQQKASKHYPVKAPLVFDAANYSTIQNKILEFNALIVQSQQELGMNQNEIELLNAFIKTLSETSRYHVSDFSQTQIQLLFSKLLQWPAANVFPVLDILRLLVLHPVGAQKVASEGNSLFSRIFDLGFKGQPVPANQLLVLRFIANLFRWESLHNLLRANEEKILGAVADCSHSDNKNVRIAMSTVILDFSVLYLEKKSQEGKIQSLSVLAEILGTEKEEEVLYRSLAALGTLIWSDDESKTLARDLEILQSLTLLKSSTSAKVKESSSDLAQFLSS